MLSGRSVVGYGVVAVLGLATGCGHLYTTQPTSVGIGLLVTFGDQTHAGWSLDVRHAFLIDDGDEDGGGREPRSGVGPFAQLAWLRGQARVSAGLFGGAEADTNQPYLSWGVELGYSYRFAEGAAEAAHGLRLGATGYAALMEIGAGASYWWGEGLRAGPEPYGAAGLRIFGPLGGSFELHIFD